MKHLKRFNENITSDNRSERFQSMLDLVKGIKTLKITPPTEEVSISDVYKGIVVKTANKIDTTGLGGRPGSPDTELSGIEVYTDFPENKNYQTNWIYIELARSRTETFAAVCFYPNESEVKQRVKSNFGAIDFNDHLIIDYNDVNHAELENLLSEFGVEVDEMWGIPR